MTFQLEKFLRECSSMETQLDTVWPDGRYTPCIPGTGIHYRLPQSTRPVSVSRAEGRALLFLAKLMNAQCAFEVGTAFGYSALMIAAGISAGRGRGWVCSLDAQLEGEIGERGVNFARKWSVKLGLQDTLHFAKGYSPQDVPKIVGNRRIDLLFIDGNHREQQPLLDLKATFPFLANDAVIAWHDAHESYGVPTAIAHAELLGFQTVFFETSCRLAISSRYSRHLELAEQAVELGIETAQHANEA